MQKNQLIDMLKGILIIFVIILHFPFETIERLQYLFPFCIDLTVPFFMIISGYVSALSFERRNIQNLEQAYNPVILMEKIMRFTIPFAIAFIAEWIVFRAFGVYLVNIRTYGLLEFALDFLRGGKGQGSYYFPLLIQLIFVFPVIYFTIRKHQLKGLGYCFLANAIFEVLKKAYGMNDVEYRLLVFRYLFVIGAGCYIAIGKIQRNYKTIVLSSICVVVGLGFAYLFSYTAYNSKIITYWRSTSFVVCLFIVPLMGWLIRHVHWGFKPLAMIGRASFNIFLIQMIYYNFADHMYEMIPGRGAQLAFNIVNCVVAGMVFYYIERPLTRFVINTIKKRMESREHRSQEE